MKEYSNYIDTKIKEHMTKNLPSNKQNQSKTNNLVNVTRCYEKPGLRWWSMARGYMEAGSHCTDGIIHAHPPFLHHETKHNGNGKWARDKT